jgi:glycosyltransferase involved in cell wall biosynthesis
VKFDEPLFGSFSKTFFPKEAQIVFVSDLFADDYVGGAELTLQALMDASPAPIARVRSKELTVEHVKQGADKYWIFGNYTGLDPRLIPSIVANVRYSLIECDYKFCRFRSLERHILETGSPCDCDDKQHGQMVSSFMAGADCTWWMSSDQRQAYLDRFAFLNDYKQIVLSSVFDSQFFDQLEDLRKIPKSSKWVILDTDNWIKGSKETEQYAISKGLEYELVGKLSPVDMLKKLAGSHGLIFHPEGADTCPRLVIEAKLLGCALDTNENVQHAHEAWFDTDDLGQIEAYLRAASGIFWKETFRHINREYTLSGYATTFNCVKQSYPFVECIESMLGFCDEVVVVDAGSTDGTLEHLRALQLQHMHRGAEELSGSLEELNVGSRLIVEVVERDWTDPRSALFDGMQKAEARRRCESDYVWQMDVDEVVRKEDWGKVREMIKNFPKAVPMLSLPVVEYWGGFDKVRLDVTPWKWRVSRNSPRITHGIPAHLRTTDSEGRLVALPGTDGCDPVDAVSGEPIVFLGFLTKEADQARLDAISGNADALRAYEEWLTRVVTNVPSVYHASWLDIERKIRLYRDFWTRHWTVLEGKEYKDTAESNMFFDKPWSEVTDDDIKARAKELKEGTGGHVFHSKWRGHNTPSMRLKEVQPPQELVVAYSREVA